MKMSENENRYGLLKFIIPGIIVAFFAYQTMKPQPQPEQARTTQTPSQGNSPIPSKGDSQSAGLSPLVGKWHGEMTEEGKKIAVWLNFQQNGTFKATINIVGSEAKGKKGVITMKSSTREGSYQHTGENSYVVVTKTVCGDTCEPHTQSSEFILNSSTELLGEGIKFRKTS